MFLEIDLSNENPIYIQLMYQIKKGIVKGELQPSEMLPSVRLLAGDIGVNMHTVNKAYNLLTEEGILVKSQKGYFVQPLHLRIQSEQVKNQMKERMKELMIDSFIHDISEQELKEWKKNIHTELQKEEQ